MEHTKHVNSDTQEVTHLQEQKARMVISLYQRESLSVLTAIFPDEPGLAGFIEAKDDGSGSDYWSHKSYQAPIKLSSPRNQHPTF